MSNLVDGLIIPRTESIHTTIENLCPGYDSTIIFSTFRGQLMRLWPIFTGEGLCYTFNSLNSREIFTDDVDTELMTVEVPKNATRWNMENGYDSNVTEDDIYPYRVFSCGFSDTLIILMGIDLDDSQLYCNGLAPGFRVSLHNPTDLPRLPDGFLFIPIEQQVYVSVRPNVITTSDGLRRYKPHKRGCFFSSERQLRFFKWYGQRNCEFECAANFTYKMCGCVQFFMPRIKGTKVCTIVDNKCYINAADEFSKNLLVKNCDCLPDCTAITYDVEISQAQKYYSASDIALKNALNESSQQVTSSLFVVFKEHHFISINRTESYTMSDFIASCGGLFGLFMGISLLSVIELIYYFTLRLCCKLRQQKPLPTTLSIYNKRGDFAAMKKQLERRRF
ncbi:pickpocket protein 28-like [Sitodiplosis mosellana]|uniref:pickpocket protein 28-like n=1 Tax=Sitodiplosis mosellana TaxID=263140 RepID=UPI002444C555|nr:pickpocket protein 28-like [Sitodiplosis mosellana]